MLPGFVPFPPEFVARYREKGYWKNLSLAQEFAVLYKKYDDRVLLVDGDHQFTHRPVSDGPEPRHFMFLNTISRAEGKGFRVKQSALPTIKMRNKVQGKIRYPQDQSRKRRVP